ncbi:MAG: response regulator [Comamonadaceae bacterium]|nr:response regulator [Comamonadaceae bacterium]
MTLVLPAAATVDAAAPVPRAGAAARRCVARRACAARRGQRGAGRSHGPAAGVAGRARRDGVPGPEEALGIVDAGTALDVVLSDIVMPGEMDGIALARALADRAPTLPVVLISGFSNALQGAHGFRVLSKPCTPEDLVLAPRRAIDSSPATS